MEFWGNFFLSLLKVSMIAAFTVGLFSEPIFICCVILAIIAMIWGIIIIEAWSNQITKKNNEEDAAK